MVSNKNPIINPDEHTRNMQSVVLEFLKRRTTPSSLSFFGVSNGITKLKKMKATLSHIYVDLESCYESITYSRVVGVLKAVKMPFAVDYAKYCVYNGSLMRGGKASNLILEQILRRMDYRLHGLATKYGFIYRRYVDDLFFFHINDLHDRANFPQDLQMVIDEEGFIINYEKSQSVTR